MSTLHRPVAATIDATESRVTSLRALERKVLWLAMWTIHHANHLRPRRDGLKVGGHQASSSSIVTLMTALYFDILRSHDRVAVKPHASPVFHAIQYLFGRQDRGALQRFRAFGGAQSYPSRTKDADDVDFSTGSVGLGVAITTFASLVQDYVRLKGLGPAHDAPGRMVALLGDAEFDEGNVFEAMLEGWKHDVRNVWWIIDYNRQSLDSLTPDRLCNRFDLVFRDMGWDVVKLKYGRQLERAFQRRGGDALRQWLDDCSNAQYSALTAGGAAGWRARLLGDLGDTSGIRELLDEHDDEGLRRLMTNLAGHDLETILEAFHGVDGDAPTCFIAYTLKGYGLPFAGHKDNHSRLMTPEQMDAFRREMNIREGQEWEPFEGLDLSSGEVMATLQAAPFNSPAERNHEVPRITVPDRLDTPAAGPMSTQEGFGRVMASLARQQSELADRIVTISADVATSTNLGPWVNRRGVFDRARTGDEFAKTGALSPQKWTLSPEGQHIELGIAENSLFTMLAALGLSAPMFGARLIPIGTVYDPFISRGLDALNYACYQDARFILVATPSGITLAPEGGAHQSVLTPLIGIGQPSLAAFEPAFVDELAEILRWSLEHVQDDAGGSVYLRLSTRPLAQPARELSTDQRTLIVEGGYWLMAPAPNAELAFVASGPVVQEALDAHRELASEFPGTGLLVVTSPGRLHDDWLAAQRGTHAGRPAVERLLAQLPHDARLLTLLDGHPATLSWLGAVRGHRISALGVEAFGQSGDIPDLYRYYRLDASAILDAVARLFVIPA